MNKETYLSVIEVLDNLSKTVDKAIKELEALGLEESQA